MRIGDTPTTNEQPLRVGNINELFNIKGSCTGRFIPTKYEDDPLAFWISENRWKDKELKYLLERLEMSEDENKCLRRKLYIREEK